MARMQNGGSGPELSDRALLTSMEMTSLAQNTVEPKKPEVISSLDSGYTGEDSQEVIVPLLYKYAFSIDEEGRTVIKIQRICRYGRKHTCMKTYFMRRGWCGLMVKASSWQSFECQFEPCLRAFMAAPLWCALGCRSRTDVINLILTSQDYVLSTRTSNLT
jgi:hypothetical protein